MSSLRTLGKAFSEACLALLSSVFRKGKLFWLALAYHGAKPILLLGVIPRLDLAWKVSLGVLVSMVGRNVKKRFPKIFRLESICILKVRAILRNVS